MVDHLNWLSNPAFVLPAYTYAEAGRYARTSPANVRRWFRNPSRRGAVLSPLPEAGRSYIQLIEVRFVATMRARGIKLDELRRARAYIRKELQVEHPFAHVRFKKTGINLLLESLADFEGLDDDDLVLAPGLGGQLGMRQLLEGVITELDYDHEIAVRWYPRGRQEPIIIDPRMSFGRPTVVGTGIPTTVLYHRYHAGDSKEFLADDFRLSPEQVDAGIAFEEGLKAA